MWRLTEDEYQKLLTDMQAKSSRRLPKPKPAARDVAKTANGVKKARARKGKGCYRIVIIARRCRAIDPDNLIAKWAIDELVNAGYLPDDSSRYIEAVEKRVEVVEVGKEETIIEIWREEHEHINRR